MLQHQYEVERDYRDLSQALLEDVNLTKKKKVNSSMNTQTSGTPKKRLREYVICVCYFDLFEYNNKFF